MQLVHSLWDFKRWSQKSLDFTNEDEVKALLSALTHEGESFPFFSEMCDTGKFLVSKWEGKRLVLISPKRQLEFVRYIKSQLSENNFSECKDLAQALMFKLENSFNKI